MTGLILVAAASLLGGCSSTDKPQTEEAVLPPIALARGAATVVGAEGDSPIALGAVVRVTHDAAVVVAAVRDDVAGPFRVRLTGDAPVAARILGRGEGTVILAVLRAGRDLRPLELAPDAPSPLAQAAFVSARSAHGATPVPCSIAADPPAGAGRSPGVAWLAAAPPLNDDDDRPADVRAAEAEGGLALDRQGRFLGVVGPPDRGLPRLVVATHLVQRFQDAILAVPGADLVRPDDAYLTYVVRAEAVNGLPTLAEEEGSGPMLVLEVRVAGDLAGRIEVTPGRPRTEVFISARSLGPVSVQLVALDRNLAQGETRAAVSKAASFFAIKPRLDVDLELDSMISILYPRSRVVGRTRARLVFEPVDPDREGGLRRTPLLPAAIAPGRPSDSLLDLPAGRATEFLTISDSTSEEVVALLYRRRLGARVAFTIFEPNYESDLVHLVVDERRPHIALATGRLLKGRVIARVRQLSGRESVPCEVLVAPRNDASAVVAPLFRLVNREAAREGTAFMDSDAFIEEVAEALQKSGLQNEALCRAILDELGGRVQVSRRLAFCLLERHFIPPRSLLEEAFGSGTAAGTSPAALDAGLILAELDPRDPRVRGVMRRACGDSDPYVRARAVRSASRGGDAAFMEEIAALCEKDTAPIVEKAVAAARLNASLLRQGQR